MYRIFLDCKEKALLVPKEVTDAIGAMDDFGLWVSATGTSIKINRDYYKLPPKKPGKAGRPMKHRSNMDKWDEKEKAYRLYLGALNKYSRVIADLSFSNKSRFMICGEMNDEGEILFHLRNAALCETLNLTGYSVVMPNMLCKLKRQKMMEGIT